MSRIHEIWKGIGNTFIKGVGRVIKISHDDAGWIELGGVRLYLLSVAITANVTTTSVPAGSLGLTSNATGRGTPFYSDGTHWQVWVTGATTKASGAEVNTGTDDAKFVTAKAIADSNVISVAAQTHIADPTGAATDQDDEARAAIVSILNALEAAGIVAAS
jgi:hypothetical protein